jgi:hypothetical protein
MRFGRDSLFVRLFLGNVLLLAVTVALAGMLSLRLLRPEHRRLQVEDQARVAAAMDVHLAEVWDRLYPDRLDGY